MGQEKKNPPIDHNKAIEFVRKFLSETTEQFWVVIKTVGEPPEELASFLIPAAKKQATADPCSLAILEAIRKAGHRLTKAELTARLEPDFSERTIQDRCSIMMEEGILDNRHDGKHRGYGIPE